LTEHEIQLLKNEKRLSKLEWAGFLVDFYKGTFSTSNEIKTALDVNSAHRNYTISFFS